MPSGLPPGDTISQQAQYWRKAGVCADRVHVLRLLVRAIAGRVSRPWMALATVGPARRAWKAREGGRAPMGPCGARGAPCTGPWRGCPLQEESDTPAVLILGRAERQNRPAHRRRPVAALCHRSGTPRGERTERLGLARQGATTVLRPAHADSRPDPRSPPSAPLPRVDAGPTERASEISVPGPGLSRDDTRQTR
jgi:hypothetical protein